ncbi:TIGR01244 family sulfur transferase [Altererythrobacter arenosus]|uniref:TIGR01244 family sulfur transferase n=1 Tax=Altererythrobacter arenosus TaxID=3032592 RepID=A0ABY8FSA8_9SPHN|nr:TIGR01244 family sulfur transferase [Altererythrobacter sp. CAU 1644]WFL77647.1 TIGR01244 family sulfur transferase [Altererythrobacter sp. CAU 1644]
MDIRQVDSNFAVAPQIRPEDMQSLADAGYVAIMCNRPDGEEPGQPDTATMRAAAEAAGLAFHHVPVSGGQFPQAALEQFSAVRRETDGPLLAYCRTGTRCITMETLSNPQGLSVDERLGRASAAGYDLSALAGHLRD